MLGKKGAGTSIEAKQNGAVFIAADIALDPANTNQPLTSSDCFHCMQACTGIYDHLASWQLHLFAVLQGLNSQSSSLVTFWLAEKQREGEVATP